MSRTSDELDEPTGQRFAMPGPPLSRNGSDSTLFMDSPELAKLNLRRRSRFKTLQELMREPRYVKGIQVIHHLQDERRREGRFIERADKNNIFTNSYSDAYSRIEEARKLSRLEKMFLEADTDGSGDVSLEEFKKCVNKEGMRNLFSDLGIQPHESIKIFKSMQNGEGEVRVKDFMAALLLAKDKWDRECLELFG